MTTPRTASGGDVRLLTPAEVAHLFRVDTKTVTRWAQARALTSVRTIGGHRRYREDEVLAVLNDTRTDRAPRGTTH